MKRMRNRAIKKAIGKTIIIGTMLAASYVSGFNHSQPTENIESTKSFIEVIPNGYINAESKEFHDYFVDMRQVVDSETSGDGLQLYYEDGSGYWWER